MTLNVGDKVEVVKFEEEYNESDKYLSKIGVIVDDGAMVDYQYEVEFHTDKLETLCFKEEELKKLNVVEEYKEEYYSVKFKRINVHDAANLLKSKRIVFYTRQDSGNVLWGLDKESLASCVADESTIYLTADSRLEKIV